MDTKTRPLYMLPTRPLNVNGLNAPTKDKDWLNGYKNKTLIYVPQNKEHIQTESEALKKDIPLK